MPGAMSAAAATTVLPLSLSVGFERHQEFPVRSNLYVNGEFQATTQSTVSRKRWKLSKKLSASTLTTLRTFYDARFGRFQSFYFYDPYETSPKFSYDATGVATTGRYKVRFDMDWQQSTGPVRSDVDVVLLEVE